MRFARHPTLRGAADRRDGALAAEIPLAERRSGYSFMRPKPGRCRTTTPPIPACCGCSTARRCGTQGRRRRTRPAPIAMAMPHQHEGRRGALSGLRHGAGRPVDLEQRINLCRTDQQQATPLPFESRDLLALTAFVARQSRGMPIEPGATRSCAVHRQGPRDLRRRQGQLNLRCAKCHDENWGKRLAGSAIAQGHPTGYPLYAKLILVGDDRQLSSIDRGGMFGALKDRHGAAELTEVKRQHKNDDRRASEMMAEGNFHDALGIYEQKGAIHWTRTQAEARAALVEQWAKDSAAAPGQIAFRVRLHERRCAQLNAALRAVRKQRGELGADHELETAHGRRDFAVGDRIQFTGTDKKAGIYNGAAGTIEAIEGTASRRQARRPAGQERSISTPPNFDEFRHGYAGTIYNGQGRTLDQTYLYHSEHWRSAASYVALTRHRDKAELFVARNTARDIASSPGKWRAPTTGARPRGSMQSRRSASSPG